MRYAGNHVTLTLMSCDDHVIVQVDHDLTRITRERVIDGGIGIDLVCLTEQPLHAVPLFRVRIYSLKRDRYGSGGERERGGEKEIACAREKGGGGEKRRREGRK